MPWSFCYDALFKEDESDEGEEEEGEEEGKEKVNEEERRKRELCDARVITMEELMNELDLGPIIEENKPHKKGENKKNEKKEKKYKG